MFPSAYSIGIHYDNRSNSSGDIHMNTGIIDFSDADYAFAVSGMGNYSDKIIKIMI